ncbi:hypothetical protein ABMA27_012575 [Loxostege sticticalis]|uniref:NADP-dependent oxidoreductase domain-containing protein n=1 Tax=Loxostege sticticalis TaxID=481309 RepID=A0ABR3GZ31_LOXSC
MMSAAYLNDKHDINSSDTVGHSRLLKYLLPSPMAEIKYKFDYAEPENVESEVPGEQKLRENLDNTAIEKATVWDEDKIETPEDYILAPVVTITKNEATFTKGDMKLQKVTVTENVSEIRNGVFHTIKAPSYPPIHSDVIHSTPIRRMDFNQSEFEDQPPQPIRSSENTSMDHKSQSVFGHVSQRPMRSLETQRSQPEERRTRIPTRFKTAVDRVRRERSMPAKNMTETLPTPPRRSSIPRLKTKPPSPKPEEEFEKLFSEIANSPTDIDISLLNNKVEDPEKVEDIFEEIIHAYDENKLQPIVVETLVATPKQNDENKVQPVEKPKSKIPMLKRKSEAEIEVPKSVQTNAKIDPPADKNRFRDVATKVSKAETHESKLPSRITKRSNVDSDNIKLKTSYQRVESISKDGQKHEVRVENIAKVSLEQDISPDNVVNIDNVAPSAIMESTVEIVSITPEIKPVNLSNEITAQPYSVEIVELPSTVEEVQNKSILIEKVTENEPKTEVKKTDVPKDETKIPIDPVKIIYMDEYQNMIREDIKEFKEFKPVSKVNRNGTVVHNDNNDYNIESCARDRISENKDFVAKPPNVENKISNFGTDERVTQLRKTIRLDSKKETNDEDGEVKHKSVLSKIAMFEVRDQNYFLVGSAPVTNNLVNRPKINDNKVQDAIVTTLHEKPKIEHVTDLKQSPFDFTPKTHDNKSNKHKITPMMSTEEIFNAYKAKNEDYNMRKAKSVAELDLGDAVKGKVHNLIVRMKSMDKSVEKKEAISAKERPRKKSVSEKIAMFEGIFTGATGQHVNNKYQREEQKRLESVRSEEEYKKLLEELTAAKQTYGQNTSMKKVTLSNGEEMPVMALGTALLDNRLAPAIIETAIDLGYRAFDTAFIYGNEKAVGEGIRKKIEDGTVKREDLFIINKLWSTFHRRDLVEKAYKQSLENLGLDYVDLYLVHNPMSFKEGPNPVPMIAKVIQYSESDYLDAWYGMEDLVTKGLVKSIGLSNFNSSQVQKILDRARVKPVVNQVECHPYLSQQRLYDFCDERHIKLSCFGVLGSKGTPQEHKNTSTAAIDDPMVKVMAAGLNVSPAQLLIRYQLQSDHTVVVKASTGAHLWDNLQALNIKLGEVEMDALRAMNRNKRTFVFKGLGHENCDSDTERSHII